MQIRINIFTNWS